MGGWGAGARVWAGLCFCKPAWPNQLFFLRRISWYEFELYRKKSVGTNLGDIPPKKPVGANLYIPIDTFSAAFR